MTLTGITANNIQGSTVATMLTAAFKALEIELPKPIAQAEQSARTIDDAFGRVPSIDVNKLAVDELTAGRNPLDNPDFQRGLAREALGARIRGLQEEAWRRFATALLEHREDAANRLFDRAEEIYTRGHAAHEALGPIHLDDAHSIINRGQAAIDHWNHARTLNVMHPRIIQAWGLIHRPSNLGAAPLEAWAVATLDQIDSYNDLFKQDQTPWAAIGKGIKLDLTDLEGLAKREEAREAALAKRRRDREEAKQKYQAEHF